MKLLLVGNHTCGNRGDGAILRGLIAELRKQEPSIELDIYSRFPVSSSYLLSENLQMDPLDEYHSSSGSFKERLWKKVSRRFLGYRLAKQLKSKSFNNLPLHIKQHVNTLNQYDAVIQVGGSFFVDLYGPAQFEHALSALIAKKPLFLVGHSVGPFESKRYAQLANTVFSLVNELALREFISLEYIKKSAISDHKVTQGADTAWLVPNDQQELPSHLAKMFTIKPTIAITLRELAPFDNRLGVTQTAYETHFASLIDNLIKDGYQVALCSTCTGIDSYQRDDRMIALKVKALVNKKEFCHVVMDELNDIELGSFFNQCKLTIGTRLHSAIISMNFNTPAIALNYEHKSKGIMNQLNMPELSQDISSLFDGELLNVANKVLMDLPSIKQKMKVQVKLEKQRACDMVGRVLKTVVEK